MQIDSLNLHNGGVRCLFVCLAAFSQSAFFGAVDQAVPLTIWLGILSLSVEIIASVIG